MNFYTLGADEKNSKGELKKIKLFNGFCYTWYIFSILVLSEDLIQLGYLRLVTLKVCLFMTACTVVAQIVHYYQYRQQAYLLFLFNILSLTFIYSNFIYKGELLEYYYMLVPAISLLFINQKAWNYSILLVAYACFSLPNLHFEHYPVDLFNDSSTLFLFFSIFILINYFKNINIQNERALEEKSKKTGSGE